MALKDDFAENPAIDAVLGPLKRHLNTRDERIVDIMINRPGELWLQIAGKDGYSRYADGDITRAWCEMLTKVLARTSSLPFDEKTQPMLMCTLPAGHRFTALIGDQYCGQGVAISIRLRRHFVVDLERDYGLSAPPVAGQTSTHRRVEPFPPDMSSAARLRALIARGANILISGGTGTGKTTMMNSLGSSVPDTKRVITVEDVREINLPHIGNQLNLKVSRQTGENAFGYSQVIDAITRLNPDNILVQELSIHNASAAFRLLNTGHKGFMSTVHGNNPLDALEAWRRNYELLEKRGGETVVRFLARNLDAIVQIDFADDGVGRHAHVVFTGEDGTLDMPWRDLVDDGGAGVVQELRSLTSAVRDLRA